MKLTKSTILIDANNVCHIALHSMGELSFLEMKTGVIFGFFIRLLKLWEEFGSNRFVICWDSRKRFRSSIYPEYKANRSSSSSITPEERVIISKQMDILRLEILPLLGFNNIHHQTGYEADDLIAAAVLDRDNPGPFIIVSTDKDLYQLLTFETCQYVYNTVTGKKMSAFKFRETYDLEPMDWVHVKAMAGDPSDNVSGIPGIGEKSAIAYLHGTLKGKKEADIVNSKKIIARNRALMNLPLDWPGHTLLPRRIKGDQFSIDKFIDVFDRYGFQSFLRPEKLDKWREFINE